MSLLALFLAWLLGATPAEASMRFRSTNIHDTVREANTNSIFTETFPCAGTSDDTEVLYNDQDGCAGDEGFTFDDATNLVDINEATDGDFVGLRIENDLAAASGSLNETAQIRFGFGTDTDVARLVTGKLADFFTGASSQDAFMAFSVDNDNTSTEIMRAVGSGLIVGDTGNNHATFEVKPLTGFTQPMMGVRTTTGAPTIENTVFEIETNGQINMGANSSSLVGQLTIVNRNTRNIAGTSAVIVNLDGDKNHGAPAQLSFGHDGVSKGAIYWAHDEPGTALTFPSGDWFGWSKADRSSVTTENPIVVFNSTPIYDMTLTSGLTLGTQRSFIFQAQTINGIAGGATETCSTCATVYIEAAPSGSDITFTNGPYALWVDSGEVRFDGNVTYNGTQTSTGDLTIQKADPTLIYDVVTATDTDFWAGVQDDAGSDNDDSYQIGTGTTPGSNTQLTLDKDGNLTIGAVNTGNGAVELAAGQWTPTTNNIANLDSSSATEGQYLRVGATVTGSVQLTVDPTLASTSTQLELDLPVSSNFGATSDAAGSCSGSDLVSEVAGIRADTASNELEVLWVTTSLASHELDCTFSYQII